MKGIVQKIKSIFKIARLLSSEDTLNYLQGVFSYMGSTPRGQIFIPYGTIGRPPDNSQMAVFSQNGNESNAIALASDPKNRTFKDLEPSEHGISNYLTGDHLLFRNGVNVKEDGTAELVTDQLTITTGDVKLVMNTDGITITGGFIIHNVNRIDDTHVHSQGNDSDGDSEQDTTPPVN